MYKRAQQGWLKHLDFIILDMVCMGLSNGLAHLARHGSIAPITQNRLYLNLWIILLVFDLLIMLLAGTMHNVVKRGYFKELTITLWQDLLVFGAVTIFLFTGKDADLISRAVLWLTIVFHVIISYLTRIAWKSHLIRRGAHEQNRSMLLVADRENARKALERFRQNAIEGIRITGLVISDRAEGETGIDGIPIVCELEDAPKYICREWIDEVYISMSPPPAELIERCTEMGMTTHRELHSVGSDHQFVELIAGVHVITNTMNTMTPAQMLAKRTLDILGGLAGSVVALIVMVVFGPKIKKESPGPILFKQERIGQNGKRFHMYKIRSMYMDAEARKAELMQENRVVDNLMFKVEFDPRIIGNKILPDGTRKTGVGEFIRRTSLDEFPQFFNILLGQMSLVGTRPPTVDEWEKYAYHHRARLAIKPGLTGMWQVSGRSKITDFEQVVKLDTEYINTWTFGLDIRILLKTVISVLRRDGAM